MRRLKIAVGEEDMELRECARLLLERLGHEVAVAADAAELAGLSRDFGPDLVLAGWAAPEPGGPSAAASAEAGGQGGRRWAGGSS
jgi:DNA-binding response OmpR family regulator